MLYLSTEALLVLLIQDPYQGTRCMGIGQEPNHSAEGYHHYPCV